MDLMEAIKGRRSIRKYKSTVPSDKDIGVILGAARWAPSWANTQCWELILVKDPAVKQQLAATLPEKNPARQAFSQAPVIIAACAHKEKAGYFKGSPGTDKGDWFMFDVALALQNLTLAAHALGLGTVHVGFFDARTAGELLGVPSGVAVVELLPLGYPDEQPAATSRRPIEDSVFYESYGRTQA